MAVTFTNFAFDNVIDPLNTIISNEFAIPVRFDKHTGNQSFLIEYEDDTLEEQAVNMQIREYTINIVYQLKTGGQYTRNKFEQVSKITERLKRLLYNNKNYYVSSTNKFYNGTIESINYERDEDDPSILNSTTTFNCLTREIV